MPVLVANTKASATYCCTQDNQLHHHHQNTVVEIDFGAFNSLFCLTDNDLDTEALSANGGCSLSDNSDDDEDYLRYLHSDTRAILDILSYYSDDDEDDSSSCASFANSVDLARNRGLNDMKVIRWEATSASSEALPPTRPLKRESIAA